MNVDRDFVRSRLDALRQLTADCRSRLEEFGDEPHLGSEADSELNSFADPELIQTALGQGAILAVIVRDHIEAFLRAIDEPALTIAPWSCVRSSLEAATLGCWLLERGVGAVERVSRSLAYRYEGLKQQRTFAEATGKPGEPEKAERRIGAVASTASALGLPVFRNKSGKITGIAKRMPQITELAESVLESGKSYRLLSAMVHAHHWAFLQLGFEPAATRSSGTSAGTGGRIHPFRKGIPWVGVVFLCVESGSALHEVSASLLTYLGGDAGQLEPAYQRFAQQVQP